ncbi:aminodeoxychorismate lyase [Planctomonas sp. JC2975]|uniref:aminodeoxychorismate lyase n=1 Tax=Planctomonas sp. JC2975 TaxID=2729626 RepID=UPI003211E883
MPVFMLDVLPSDSSAAVAGTVHRVETGTVTLDVRDLGPSRGDGVFETIGVVDGHPQALDAHLKRLANSAHLLDLPEPHEAQWRHAITVAAASLSTQRQGGLKIVLTRGVEGTGTPTGWIVASEAAGDFAEREAGIRVITLDRGYTSDVAARAPWLLAGAKTLSYAVNMAALREARRRGADDVVFVSSDGYVMEAPTSTVILRFGDCIVTPRTDIGILPGTSQLSVFAFAEARGLRTEEALVPVGDLTRADAAWLVSSVRLAAPITHVDGADVPVDLELTRAMNAALLAREN